MKVSLFTVAIFLLNSAVTAQNCSCEKSVQELKKKVEDNYAGFQDKITEKTIASYRLFTTKLLQKAARMQTGKNCQVLLQQYINYFKDKHLILEGRYTASTVTPAYMKLPANTNDYFKKQKLSAADIRGIWKNENYELAILQLPGKINEYAAVIISSKNENWKKGMIKMYLKKETTNYYSITYFTADFSEEKLKAFFEKNILDILSVGVFEKTEPFTQNAIKPETYTSVFPNADIKFSFPNDSTAVLFLGSFGNSYELLVDSLMKASKAELEKRPYWLIDISYNSGGGTGTYKPLIPYLYTNTIKRSGSYYLLSEDNVKGFADFLVNNPGLPVTVNTFLSKLVAQGKAKPNSWFFDEGDEFNFTEVTANPKYVGVLVSQKTASSGEIFIMDARQSKKVTVFGSQTAGVVDYGDGMIHTVGCDSIMVSIPTRKSEYLKTTSYDNKGLKPDVPIPGTTLFPYELMMRYYKNKKQ